TRLQRSEPSRQPGRLAICEISVVQGNAPCLKRAPDLLIQRRQRIEVRDVGRQLLSIGGAQIGLQRQDLKVRGPAETQAFLSDLKRLLRQGASPPRRLHLKPTGL